MKYTVTLKFSSLYENKNENKTVLQDADYEAKDLENLWTILEEEDYDDDIVLNFNAKSDFITTERDEIKIIDQNNKLVWSEKE